MSHSGDMWNFFVWLSQKRCRTNDICGDEGKKSCIQETKNLLNYADSGTDTKGLKTLKICLKTDENVEKLLKTVKR